MYNDIIWASSFAHSLVPIEGHNVKRVIREERDSYLRAALHERGKILLQGCSVSLPLEGFQWLDILRLTYSKELLLDLWNARVQKELTSITGLAMEQRSYHHFLIEHYGEHFTNAIWGNYLLRRWGRTSDQLSAQLGRLLHSSQNDTRVEHFSNEGTVGEIQSIRYDQAVKITTEQEEIIGERLWIDAPVQTICSLLVDIPRAIQVDLEDIEYLDQQYISVQGTVNETIHILDDGPVFALVPGDDGKGGKALLSNDRSVELKELSSCLQRLDLKIEGDIEVFPNYAPVWLQGNYTKYLRVLEYLVKHHIYPIGLGTYTPCTTAQQQEYIQLLLNGAQASDAHRRLFDPFVKKVSFRKLSFR